MQVCFHRRDVLPLSRRCTVCLVCCLLLAFASQLGWAWPPSGVTSSAVEAAYLYNFGKFVRFPSDPGQDHPDFSICILGDDSFGVTLDSLIANEFIQGHRIVAPRLTSVAAATNCQIVFIATSEGPRVEKDLALLKSRPILTVSSLPHFLQRGGMIEFELQNNRVRFAVNLAAAEESSLSLSSELLKVAVRVDSTLPSEAK